MPIVTTSPAGNKFEVASDSTILSAAMEAGVNLPYGCGNGFCGTCKAKLIVGKTFYTDNFIPESLTDEEKTAGMVLCCKAHPESDLTIEVHEIINAEEIEPKEFNVKIISIEKVTDDVIIMQIGMGEDNHMQFLSGQYLEFILDDGTNRAFSIANAPRSDGKIELHLRHVDSGTFTNQLFAGDIKPGDILRVKGPLGTFFLREDSKRDIIMIAGGTGLAPIKGMLEHALDEKTGKNIHLYWGVKDVEDLYMHELITRLVANNSNITYIPVLSANTQPGWNGRTGFVTDAVVEDYSDLSEYEVYMAGPPVMVDAGKAAFKKLGLPEDRIYSDSFEIAG